MGDAMWGQSAFLRLSILAGALSGAAMLGGCGSLYEPLDITNETTSVVRSASNTYSVQAHVTNGDTYSQLDLTAMVTGGATSSSTPMTSTPDKSNFFATVPADQC